MDDVKYVAHIFEQTLDQLKGINEGVTAIREELAQVPKRGEFDELKEDVKVVKASVRSLSAQVHDHEMRIGRLETA